jgi:glycine/D-amino acid oxidase-like deaminating enzyme
MSSRRFVVIGAGILGASVAARLAAAGLRVTLLDQDRPGRATSRWSFAWINSNDKGPRPYHDLNHAGIKAWAELTPDLDGHAWYRPSGHVELAASRAELEARMQRLTDWGYPARLVDVAEAAAAAVDLHTPEPELRRWGDELLYRARRTVRGLDDARVVELKVCARPLPLDGQSVVGRLPGAQGIYVAVTHSGVTLAAHLSRLITADLTTTTPPAELIPYIPARFTPNAPRTRR